MYIFNMCPCSYVTYSQFSKFLVLGVFFCVPMFLVSSSRSPCVLKFSMCSHTVLIDDQVYLGTSIVSTSDLATSSLCTNSILLFGYSCRTACFPFSRLLYTISSHKATKDHSSLGITQAHTKTAMQDYI